MKRIILIILVLLIGLTSFGQYHKENRILNRHIRKSNLVPKGIRVYFVNHIKNAKCSCPAVMVYKRKLLFIKKEIGFVLLEVYFSERKSYSHYYSLLGEDFNWKGFLKEVGETAKFKPGK